MKQNRILLFVVFILNTFIIFSFCHKKEQDIDVKLFSSLENDSIIINVCFVNNGNKEVILLKDYLFMNNPFSFLGDTSIHHIGPTVDATAPVYFDFEITSKLEQKEYYNNNCYLDSINYPLLIPKDTIILKYNLATFYDGIDLKKEIHIYYSCYLDDALSEFCNKIQTGFFKSDSLYITPPR